MDRPLAGKVIRLLVLGSGYSATTTSDCPFIVCQVGITTGKGKVKGQFCWLESKKFAPPQGNH
jgi:hypothetical protein